MQVSKRIQIVFLGAALVLMSACKKEITEQVVYDNVIYQLNDVVVYQSNVEKVKQKTPTQYISILFSDLFNTQISNNDLSELSTLYLAIGDKGMANELLLTHWLVTPGVVVPTDQTMRADVDQFVIDTYVRFFQRLPTEYEKHYLVDEIEDDTLLTPEAVYIAFALSNEYQFY